MASSVEGALVPGYIAPNSIINDPEIRADIFPRYREDTLFNVLIHSGRTKVSKQTKFQWAEHDYLYSTVDIASVPASGGAGASIDITITTDSHQESGAKSPGKATDLIMVGNIRGYITATDKNTPNAHVYTVFPVNDADDIGAAAQTATTLSLFSNAHPDGSDQPESMVRKPLDFYNFTQIFKTQYMAYGSEAANRSEFLVEEGGSKKPYWYLQGVTDAALKHDLDIEFALIFGEISSGLQKGGDDVFTTRGMDSYIRNFGTSGTYTTAYDFTTLKADVKVLNAERAPKKNWQLCGINVMLDIEDAMFGKVNNSGFNPAEFGFGSNKEKMLEFGVDGYTYGGYKFMKTNFNPLDYQPFSQSADGKWSGVIYTVPFDRVKNPRAGQSGEDEWLDTIALRFKENDRENRLVKHWTRDITTTNLDRLEFNHRSELGLQFACANQTIVREAA